jgi:hypothetical protein
VQIVCADCGCLPEECKSSYSPTIVPVVGWNNVVVEMVIVNETIFSSTSLDNVTRKLIAMVE